MIEKKITKNLSSKQKVLVTGGAGFIGSHLCEELIKRGHQVTAIDNLSTGSKENLKNLNHNPNFHLVIDTVLNEIIIAELISDCDIVYHLAAAVGVKYIIENPLLSIQTNILGTEIVLKHANYGKKKVILSSTSEIYGKNENGPLSEEHDRILGSTSKSRWSYSSTKAVDEFLALAYWREKKLPIVIVRLFNTCGPRQTGQYGMVIPRFIKQALLNHDITIYGDGKQSRCFTYINDAIEGIIALAEHPEAVGQIFNLGSTEEITIEELAKKIVKMTHSRSRLEYISYEKAYEEGFEDMRRRVPDITKVNNLIGFQPKANLDEILRSTIEYFEK